MELLGLESKQESSPWEPPALLCKNIWFGAAEGQVQRPLGRVMGEVTDRRVILERTLLVAISKLNWLKH